MIYLIGMVAFNLAAKQTVDILKSPITEVNKKEYSIYVLLIDLSL